MRLFLEEGKKLASFRMLWLYILLCILLNGMMIGYYSLRGYDQAFVRYVDAVAAGQENFADQQENLADQTGKGQEDAAVDDDGVEQDASNQERLQAAVGDGIGWCSEYQTEQLAERYVSVYHLKGICKWLMEKKYEKLQERVDAMAEEGADLSLYAADQTEQIQEIIFSVLCRCMYIEAFLLSVFLMFYSLGYEHANATEAMVYASKRGRQILFTKMMAAIVFGMLSYVLLLGATSLILFRAFDYPAIWDSNISSGYNIVRETLGAKPFITWASFTLREYYLFSVLLGLVLNISFSLLAACLGILFRNEYMGEVFFFLLGLAMFSLPYFFARVGFMTGYFVLEFSPVCLWFLSPYWLTESGIAALFPWHEICALGIELLAGAVLLKWCYYIFCRKDIRI